MFTNCPASVNVEYASLFLKILSFKHILRYFKPVSTPTPYFNEVNVVIILSTTRSPKRSSFEAAQPKCCFVYSVRLLPSPPPKGHHKTGNVYSSEYTEIPRAFMLHHGRWRQQVAYLITTAELERNKKFNNGIKDNIGSQSHYCDIIWVNFQPVPIVGKICSTRVMRVAYFLGEIKQTHKQDH